MWHVSYKSENESGFSLVELLVVIAIVGTLVAIAVPSFQSHQMKAKQKSGQALLAGFYASMKSTHSEYSHYFGDFVAIGFRPTGSLVYFLASAAEAPDPGPIIGFNREQTCVDVAIGSCTTAGFTAGVDWTLGPTAVNSNSFDPIVTRFSFVAEACADLGADDDELDCWTIDHRKDFVHTNNGTST